MPMEFKYDVTKSLDTVITISFVCFVFFSLFSISLTQVFQALGVLAWLAKTHITHSWKTTRTPLLIPIALFLVASLIASATAHDSLNSFIEIKNFLHFTIFFWTLNALKSAHPALLLHQAAHIIKNPFVADKLEHAWEKLKSTHSLIIYTNIFFIACSLAILLSLLMPLFLEQNNWFRIQGTFNHVFPFAEILMLAGTILLSKVLFSKTHFFWVYIFGFILFGLILTLTRHAWLGFCISSFIMLFLKRPTWIVFPLIFVLVLYFIAPKPLQIRLKSMTSVNDWSFKKRRSMWQESLGLIKEHPLTGCGYDCLRAQRTKIEKYPTLKNFLDLHNHYLQIVVDTGLIGLFAWLSIWICYFLKLTELRKKPHVETESNLFNWVFWGSLFAVLSFMIGGVFASSFYDSKVTMVLNFIMALPFALTQPNQTKLK